MESSQDLIWAMISFGILALFILSFAYQKEFFKLPIENSPLQERVCLHHLIFAFIIYFGTTYFSLKIVSITLKKTIDAKTDQLAYLSWLNFITIFLSMFFLFCYLFFINKATLKSIFKKDFKEKKSILFDCSIGALSWLVIYPFTLFIDQVIDYVLLVFWEIKQVPDQAAVSFLKLVMTEPFYLVLTIISIVIFAPITEEILFRGILQSFLKKFFGSISAIFLSATFFAFFHYTSNQMVANIPIIVTLFSLGLMLGFIYEKQNSLFAPITLHASFNMISIINLLILKDGSII